MMRLQVDGWQFKNGVVEERRESVETGNSVERGVDWSRVERLLELARSAHRAELSPERRERIRARLLERLEQNRRRRRLARAFAAGASMVLLAGLLVRLFNGGLPWLERSGPEIAGKRSTQEKLVVE